MASNYSLSVLSPCHKYIATVSENSKTLQIHLLDSQNLHRSYDISNHLKNHLIRNGIESFPKVQVLKFSQLTWEEIIPGSDSTKIGVVIDNYAILLIFDIRSSDDKSSPIIIQQSKSDEIESFQWIPPPTDDVDNDSGGYVNSKQFVVFTKMKLHMKLYSVDCTHILFTVLKPILNEISVHPHKHNRYWSIIATPVEYNAPTLLFHFYNEGSISSLLQTHKLPSSLISTPSIKWSVSGNWFSLLDANTNLFGVDLDAFGFVIGFEPNRTTKLDPVLSIQYSNEEVSQKDGKLELGNTDYLQSWFQTESGCEYILVASVNENDDITILIFSISLLRLIHKEVIKSDKNGWVQVAERGQVNYKQNSSISLRGSPLEAIKINDSKIYFNFHNTLIIFDIVEVKKNQVTLSFRSAIQCHSNLLELSFIKQGSLIVSTESHILDFNFESNSVSIPYQNTNLKLKRSYSVNDEIVILNESVNGEEVSVRNWEIIKTNSSLLEQENRFETIKPFKRARTDNNNNNNRISLLASNSFTNDEITDTFNQKKRLKRIV
ncbi:hypothetical protein DFJ63DRAFT_24028 [Scheffersomyces coipomensis]|uniref:uncharacterized protein n=1 Tax=Scheffersomyces coipomensis TaxID=1788519 RepID=UPI00315D353F